MSTFYTPKMINFINSLRDEGYSWQEIETEFREEFGVHKSHDTLRITAKNFKIELDDEVDDEYVTPPNPRLQKAWNKYHKDKEEKLPEYLLYSPKKYKQIKQKTKGTALIIPDCHIPYADMRAYDLMLAVAKDIKDLSEVVILGDYADFYAVNSHGKHPLFSHVLVEEVNHVRKELERLNKIFPKAKKVFISGNHEYRLERYIQDRCPELFGIADTKSILQLDQLGYEFIEYGPNQKYKILGSKLYARHEPVGGGQHPAAGTVAKAGCSMIFGHVHRIQQYRSVFMDGNDHLAACVGWLGDKDHPVMQYVKSHPQWQLGFGLVTATADGKFFLDTKHIIDYSTYHNGKLYKG